MSAKMLAFEALPTLAISSQFFPQIYVKHFRKTVYPLLHRIYYALYLTVNGDYFTLLVFYLILAV